MVYAPALRVAVEGAGTTQSISGKGIKTSSQAGHTQLLAGPEGRRHFTKQSCSSAFTYNTIPIYHFWSYLQATNSFTFGVEIFIAAS